MSELLVLRLSALGDVIHTLPAVVALRDALPDTKISWAVEAPYAQMVDIVANVKALPVRLKRWSRHPLDHRADIAEARRMLRGFDASIDFQGLVKSAALGWLSGARRRVGFDRAAIREKPALLFTNEKWHVDTNAHIVEQNLALARAFAPHLMMPEVDWSAFADEGSADFDGAVVLLPGAGKPDKLWPVERFRELARNIGDRAIAVWGPGERERAEQIGCRMAPPTNLRELAHILRRATVVIGGDTGPLHLAAAMGTPVVGLYGPTNPRRNGPYGQVQNVVNKFEGAKSMDAISVEEVMNLVRQGLAE
jgi:heptosyltransferase-1